MKSQLFKMIMQMIAFIYLHWEEVFKKKKKIKKIGELSVGYKLGIREGRKAKYLLI